MGDRLLRTFISVPVPESVLILQQRLKTLVPISSGKIKWVRQSQIHLTLKFLGHTPVEYIPKIQDLLTSCLDGIRPIELYIGGTGCFPRKERPRILWLGVNGEVPLLQNLVNKLDTELISFGFPVEEKEYLPHITLGRAKYPQKHTPDISKFLSAEVTEIPFKVEKIQFTSSELFPNGPVYTILNTQYFDDYSI